MKKLPKGTKKKTTGVAFSPSLLLAAKKLAASRDWSVSTLIKNLLEKELRANGVSVDGDEPVASPEVLSSPPPRFERIKKTPPQHEAALKLSRVGVAFVREK